MTTGDGIEDAKENKKVSGMAKQRRQKQKDANRAPIPSAEGNGVYEGCRATVRSQKLCVAVDIARQCIYG